MVKKIQDVYVVAAVRTPVGRAHRGVFANTRPDDLLTHVIKAVMAKVPNVEPHCVEDVIIGCAMPEAEQGMNVARISALLAGLPDSVPGMTVNRFCSSGLQTIAIAANKIAQGVADVVIAGGVESMSLVPMGGNKYSVHPACFNDDNIAIAYGMGITAEKVAAKWQVNREQQDQFALESHRRALKAIENGEFNDEIVPIDITHHVPDLVSGKISTKTQTVQHDEGPRMDTSLEKLAALRSVFAAKGTVTAGNSSQMSDGAAALLLVSETMLTKLNLTPLARFCGFNVAGVPPEIMGIGPIKAVPKVLKLNDMQIANIDWIELNEAFAAQSLAVMKELVLEPAKVNPLGGAIALGHPLGATGAIRAATIIHGLRRHQLKYGMVTMCIGTGMGAAGIFEAL